MIVQVAPGGPWRPEATRTCVRGRIMLKLRSGEAPSAVPHYLDVRTGSDTSRTRVDGGPIDAAIRRHSPGFRVARAFGAASDGAEHWDADEDATGLSRTFRVDVDPSASLLRIADALRSLEVVEHAGPQYLNTTPFSEPTAEPPSDRRYPWRLVQAEAALRLEPGDSALIVAIVDSGVRSHHAELEGRTRPGVDCVDLPVEQVSRGLTLVGDSDTPDRDPDDQMGHGTACASIVGARGLKVPAGLGGAARILPARALAAARYAEKSVLTAVGALPDIDHAVKLAVDLGARVLNLSFGTPESSLRSDDPRPHEDIIDYALRRGCILVAASGNSGDRTRYFPAAHPGVIAVGSVGESRRPSNFSTRGDHVALCGPGEHIVTAGLDGYQVNTGTSFAAPFVAAAAALLIARGRRSGVPLSAVQVRNALCATASPFADPNDATGCGAGVLDANAALTHMDASLSSSPEHADPFMPRAIGAA